ncbi:MAG: hypothetical protein ABGZ35_22245 [Planctomycetaceae bacterium]
MKWTVLFLVGIGLMGRFSIGPPEIPVFAVSLYAVSRLIQVLGRDIPILESTSVIYCLQLLIGPVISYWSPPQFARYQMAIDAEVYFAYVIPAVCVYLIPIAIARDRLPYLTQVMGFQAGRRVFTAGLVICLIGFSASLVENYVPASLRFLAFLVGELKYVGALYCYFCRHGQRRWVLATVMILTVVSSLANAMFHQLILWGLITLSLVIYRESRRNTRGLRIGLVCLGFFALITLQSYKDEYRDAIRMNPSAGIVENLGTAVAMGTFEGDTALEVIAVRLNQGWIVSNVLKHVPAREPFAGGDTLLEAMRDSLLPRVLFDKAARGGGRENFRRFTGLQISSNTSMGISPVGETYANLGVDGGIAAMFGYGIIFSGFYYFLTTRRNLGVLFLLWIPAVFSQALKSETELTVVLNHLVKAGVFCWFTYVVIHQILFGRLQVPMEQRPVQPEHGGGQGQRHVRS